MHQDEWSTTRCGRHIEAARRRLATVALVAATALLALSCSDSEAAGDPVEPATTSPPAGAVEVEVEDTLPESSSVEPQEENSAEDADVEFIELSYWEGVFLQGFSRTIQPPEECDASDPDRLVCTFEQSLNAIATHLGSTFDTTTGTITTYLSEICLGRDGSTGTLQVLDGRGSMLSPWGDELYFRTRRHDCLDVPRSAGPGYLVFDGGTGRFEDAYGTVSLVGLTPPDSGYLSTGVGTLMVRADLWAEILPPLEGP